MEKNVNKDWPVELKLSKFEKSGQSWTLVAELKFVNHSTKEFLLDGLSAAENGQLMNNLFQVKCNGKEAPYTGEMVKRAPPDNFIHIPPGKSFESKVDLGSKYKIPETCKKISVTYDSQNHFSPNDVRMKSNTVEQSLK